MVRALVLCMLLVPIAVAQQTPRRPAHPQNKVEQPATPQANAQDEALRADLARMRVLVNQMQSNLGFVGSGLTPLKHQFELEIEMWNLLIADMERRLPRPVPATPASPQP